MDGGRTIEVDMAKLSAGKYTGTVLFNAETLRMQTAQKQIPGYADKENIAARSISRKMTVLSSSRLVSG